MSREINYLSQCCFQPITINDFEWGDDVIHYCSKCGKESPKYFSLPNHEPNQRVELIVRRFADGEAKWSEVCSTIQQDVDTNWGVVLKDIQRTLDNDKPFVWEYNPEIGRWVKADEALLSGNGSRSQTEPMPDDPTLLNQKDLK